MGFSLLAENKARVFSPDTRAVSVDELQTSVVYIEATAFICCVSCSVVKKVKAKLLKLKLLLIFVR